MDQLKEGILNWLLNSDDKGISSEAMAAALLDTSPNSKWDEFGNHPSDPSDFNRCLKLVRHVPVAAEHMHKVSSLSETWKNLVDNWADLEACFVDEVGIDWSKGKHLAAEKTYEMMKRLGC